MVAQVVSGLEVVRLAGDRPDPTRPLTVGVIAAELGRTLSSTSRLCSDLESLGMLEHADAYGAYRLGPAALTLSGRAAAPFAQSVRHALLQVARQTGETVCLAAQSGDAARVIAAVVSAWTLHAPAQVGELVDHKQGAILRVMRSRPAPGRGSRAAESVTGMLLELAEPVLDTSGECVAVVAVRLPRNRIRSGVARARLALHEARGLIERALADRVDAASDVLSPAAPASRPRALEAAIRVLWHLAAGPDSVGRISRAVGLRPDRTRRIVESCSAAGLVRLDESGSEVSLAWAIHAWHRSACIPTLLWWGTRLVVATADATQESTFLTALNGMRSVTLVEELRSPGDGLTLMPWLGRLCPIIGADGGPTLLMDFEVDEIAPLIPGPPSPDDLAEFLDRVRHVTETGVLSKESLEEAGQIAVSAPVRDASGSVVAAACIVGASDRIRPRVRELEAAALELAAGVSALLDGSRLEGMRT